MSPDVEARLSSGGQAVVTVLYTKRFDRSMEGLDRVRPLLEALNGKTLELRLDELHLEKGFVQPVKTDAVDLDFQTDLGPLIASRLLPIILLMMLILGALYPAVDLTAGEKERGTLEQLRVTSLSSGQLIVGKLLPYLVISLVATTLILIAARVLFHVQVRGSYLDLYAATLLYLVGALGWGLLVSTLVDNPAMAFQISTLPSLMPAIFLSGFIFSIRAMPHPLQIVTHAVPARYFLVIARGVILKGAGLAPYLEELGFLALYATVVLGIASRRWSRRAT